MKIAPLTNYSQSFTSSNMSIKEKRADRITQSVGIIVPAIILGTGYALSGPDYYDDRKMLADNKILNLQEYHYENLLDRVNISDLKIDKVGENEFKFTAKSGNFDNLKGSITKTEEPWSLSGTFEKEGLFKTDKYDYQVRMFPRRSNGDSYAFIIKLDNEIYMLRKKNGSNKLYLNGKTLSTEEQRREQNVSIALLVLCLAGAYNIARK